MTCTRRVLPELAPVAWQGERQELRQRGVGGDAPEARAAAEDEWEATPVRAGSGRPGSSARRPDTGASLDYLASPAGTPVRAGSAGGVHAPLLLPAVAQHSYSREPGQPACRCNLGIRVSLRG